jgi:hypothetical protein
VFIGEVKEIAGGIIQSVVWGNRKTLNGRLPRDAAYPSRSSEAKIQRVAICYLCESGLLKSEKGHSKNQK